MTRKDHPLCFRLDGGDELDPIGFGYFLRLAGEESGNERLADGENLRQAELAVPFFGEILFNATTQFDHRAISRHAGHFVLNQFHQVAGELHEGFAINYVLYAIDQKVW